ncbi:MAG: 4Fe-4S dicluster domain-containing protein [Anaerolineae bacterium]|nr:4Fe-4S dicluster domain-containing protein [Anaerolineae bacterium]
MARIRLSGERIRGELVRKIEELSGQNLLACNQCGKCSAGCPAAAVMDLLPNQVIRYAQFGLEEVLAANSIWVCAACQTCYARCPHGVDLPRVMEALRVIALEQQGDRLRPQELDPQKVAELPQLAVVGGFRKFTMMGG